MPAYSPMARLFVLLHSPGTATQRRAAKHTYFLQQRSGPRARSGVRRGRSDIQSARWSPRSPKSPPAISGAGVLACVAASLRQSRPTSSQNHLGATAPSRVAASLLRLDSPLPCVRRGIHATRFRRKILKGNLSCQRIKKPSSLHETLQTRPRLEP
jgi:hypothetical protein